MSKLVKSLGTAVLACGCIMAAAGQDAAVKGSDLMTELWLKDNVTVTKDGTPAPDGTATACKAAVTAKKTATLIQKIKAAAAVNTYSIYTKKGNMANARFLVRNHTTAIEFKCGTMDYDSGIVTGDGWTADKLQDGWFLLKYTNGAAEKIAAGDVVILYAGYVGAPYNLGDYIYLWGAQFEAGQTASSLIKTTP